MKIPPATALLAVAVLLLAATQQVAGAFGTTLICMIGWAVALMVLRRRVARPDPPATRTARRTFPQRTWPSFRAIESRLWSASRSARLYDHGVRPLVSRVTAVHLEHRAGVNLAAEPERAEAVLGSDVWPLVDPRHLPSFDDEAPGVPPETLDRLLSRLEEL